jgi:hypothetical protein
VARSSRGLAPLVLVSLALPLGEACRQEQGRAWLVLEPLSPSTEPPRDVQVTPAGAVTAAAREGDRLVLTVAPERVGRALRVQPAGACAVEIPAGELKPGATLRRPVVAWLDLGPPRPQLGFDQRFTIDVVPGCPEAAGVALTWAQVEGRPLRELTISARGHRVTARTASFAEAHPAPAPWGVVPLSPARTGAAVLEARFSGDRGQPVIRRLALSAAGRATGLPNVPLGLRLHLGGGPWRLEGRPPGGTASLEFEAGLARLRPDAPGVWRLRDAADRPLLVHAGRHDELPLDCGRSGCHPSAAQAVLANPMTNVLPRAAAAAARSPGAPTLADACARACHGVGEPGVADGGLAHVSSELGVADGVAFADLPRAVRRQTGVGCLACHGAAAIPEESARWTILRSDVCAVCHDAPPRYGHVAAWRGTRMAGADRDAAARTDPACVTCHTTWGFLASAPSTRRQPPAHVGAVGLGCVTCHAVHAPPSGTGSESSAGLAEGALPGGHTGPSTAARALLREGTTPAALAPLPASAAQAVKTTGICLPCHAPQMDADRWPSASASALVFGRGGVDPETGAPLTAPAPHATQARGCLACHGAGPPALERGRSHAFLATEASCRPCHPAGKAVPDLRAEAARLRDRLLPGSSSDGPRLLHARGVRLDRRSSMGRALWNVALVLEDPAAATHNAGYARLLLGSTAAWLERNPTARAARTRGAAQTKERTP